jgi:hypothetical protein
MNVVTVTRKYKIRHSAELDVQQGSTLVNNNLK